MNRFGEIADELTDLIEEMERLDLAADGGAVKLALERAFAKACEAERSLRLRQEAEPAAVRPQRRVGERVEASAAAMGVVIELPSNWRGGAARLRRLMD